MVSGQDNHLYMQKIIKRWAVMHEGCIPNCSLHAIINSVLVVLCCILYLYSASCSAQQSEALPA